MKHQQGEQEALAHELFTAAQLAPGEGIEDAVGRLAALVEAQQSEVASSSIFDGVIPAAIRSYLRKCSSGGMSKKHIDIVQINVDEAERLDYFKLAIAEAVIASRVAAPQPAPIAPAVQQGAPVAWLSVDCIGERYLCFTKPDDSDPARPLVIGDTVEDRVPGLPQRRGYVVGAAMGTEIKKHGSDAATPKNKGPVK